MQLSAGHAGGFPTEWWRPGATALALSLPAGFRIPGMRATLPGMTSSPEKAPADSHVSLLQLMLPQHANPRGTVHGGVIMKMVDEAGAICAMRHARRPCVTVTVDAITFYSPVRVGELLGCEASVSYVGETSIEVSVKVRAENLITGELTHTNSARLVYVALDDQERPSKVPPLRLESDQERRRWEEARERHERSRQIRRESQPPHDAGPGRTT